MRHSLCTTKVENLLRLRSFQRITGAVRLPTSGSSHLAAARPLYAFVGFFLLCCAAARAGNVDVADAAGLRAALSQLEPGTVLRIAPGEYGGGYRVQGVANLTIEAADPERAPHFHTGRTAWHFSNCSGLTLRHLRVSSQSQNGINLDDGGNSKTPTKDVTLEHLDVRDVGPRGNCDAIKCSGLEDLTIRGCTIAGWGGQGIDLVGCHRILITGCRFTGKPGFTATAGAQCKGGSEDVIIEQCHFEQAGERPVNAGGSTGIDYFRPLGAKYEARRVTIRDNTFVGSPCACAFTGVDGAEFRGNRVLFPEKWVFRILQETRAEGFAPSRNVQITDNSIVFRRSQVGVEVNIGDGTAPETFTFARNRWFAEDAPDRSRPTLPTEEQDGTYGMDPR
jgi:hypothetical protein